MVDDKKQMTNGEKCIEVLQKIVDGKIEMQMQGTKDMAAKLLENPIENIGSFLAISEQLFGAMPGMLSELNMRVFTKHMKEAGILEEVMETMKDVIMGEAKDEIKH